jgi:hypothetical protein
LPALWLQVEDLFHPCFGEDMMTASDALVKSNTAQQLTEAFAGNVGVRGTPQDPKEESVSLAHEGYFQPPASIL